MRAFVSILSILSFGLSSCGTGLFLPGDRIEDRFVAVGDNGTILFADSTDIFDWKVASVPTSDVLRSVAFGNGVLVAVGDNGTIVRSEDFGQNWILTTASGGENLDRVHFSNGVFVTAGFVPAANFKIYTSSDGETWVIRDTSAFSPSTESVAGISFGNGTWSILDTAGNVSTSPDSNTWTPGVASGTGSIVKCAFNPTQGEFIAGDPAGIMYQSTDGASFTSVTGPSTGSALRAFAFGGGFSLVVSDNGEVFRSGGGATGTWEFVVNLGFQINGITMNEDFDVVVGAVGQIFVRYAGPSAYESVAAPVAFTLRDVITVSF